MKKVFKHNISLNCNFDLMSFFVYMKNFLSRNIMAFDRTLTDREKSISLLLYYSYI